MRFWDASALVPLFILEPRTMDMLALFASDADVVVSFLTPLEVASAVRRRGRTQVLPGPMEFTAALVSAWTVIADYEETLAISRQTIAAYALRTADSIQLASAILGFRDATKVPLVTLDKELGAAARAEGFPVLS